jgi:hypothetical protein
LKPLQDYSDISNFDDKPEVEKKVNTGAEKRLSKFGSALLSKESTSKLPGVSNAL